MDQGKALEEKDKKIQYLNERVKEFNEKCDKLTHDNQDFKKKCSQLQENKQKNETIITEFKSLALSQQKRISELEDRIATLEKQLQAKKQEE